MELMRRTGRDFPSFSEGLSLRQGGLQEEVTIAPISLPFRKGFH